MSPFLVYLMFQADTLSSAFGTCLFFSIAIFVFTFVVSLILGSAESYEKEKYAENYERLNKLNFISRLAVPVFLALYIFTPSTKTIAAMIVLPALTSETAIETVSDETREILEIAKDDLRSLSDKPTKAEKE